MANKCNAAQAVNMDAAMDMAIRELAKPRRFSGAEYRSTVVSVNSYRNDVLCGTAYNPFFDEPKQFNSTVQLLRIMDDAFNEKRYPQAYQTMRSFTDCSELRIPERAETRGEMATFYVRVFFRQNASWQGELIWSEGKKEASFRSVLELLLLMDGALHSM